MENKKKNSFELKDENLNKVTGGGCVIIGGGGTTGGGVSIEEVKKVYSFIKIDTAYKDEVNIKNGIYILNKYYDNNYTLEFVYFTFDNIYNRYDVEWGKDHVKLQDILNGKYGKFDFNNPILNFKWC